MEHFAQVSTEALIRAARQHSVTKDHFATLAPTLELEVPADSKQGDFAFPCFRWSKLLRTAPNALAQGLAECLAGDAELKRLGVGASAAGPYLNFRIDPLTLTRWLTSETQPARLPAATRGTWVLEYSSPNVAKPFQIYHLRPTVLGAALDRMGRLRGFRVVSLNHLGDWGTQYGKLAVALTLYANELPAQPSIEDLVAIYVRFHQEVTTRPELEDQARALFVRLEADDPEVRALWKRCVDISMREFERIYARLGVRFDHIWGESFYKDQLAPLLADLRARGILTESEGAWVVNVTDRDGRELPPCILEKKDGATIYATRDVAAAVYRYGKFAFDRMTYIVGAEQRLHFQQVFGVLRRMGLTWEARCEHIPFGLYRFKDAKMSTRKGNFVTLEATLELARTRVRELMQARAERATSSQAAETSIQAPWSESELEDTIEKVALGALVFFDLSVDPARDVEFDLERVVDFNGETGPYVQYAHTRAVSILRRARAQGIEPIGADRTATTELALLTTPSELALIRKLAQFAAAIERSLKLAKASQLTTYVVELVHEFGAFYREAQVLSDDPALSRARVTLVEAFRLRLAAALELLGIPLPERM